MKTALASIALASGIAAAWLLGACGGQEIALPETDASADGAGVDAPADASTPGDATNDAGPEAVPAMDAASEATPVDAGPCGTAVTFHLLAPGWFFQEPGPAGWYPPAWLTVTDPADAAVIQLGFYCPNYGVAVHCETCDAAPGDPECGDRYVIGGPMPDGGFEMTWSGREYAWSTCGASVACESASCAPSGPYVARLCAVTSPLETPDGGPTCIDVGFTLPSTGTVEGELPARDQ